MVIDFHAHLYQPRWYPPRFNDYLGRDILQRQSARTGRPAPLLANELVTRMLVDRTGDTTLNIMDKAGIDKRVILILDWGLELGEPETSIETIHREVLDICRRSQGRLIGFAGIDPRRESAVSLLRIAVDDLGAAGLKLHPTGGWTLDDPRTHEIVALAVGRGLPILVHIGRTMDILSARNSQPEALIALARQFPNGKFIAGHSGFELFLKFVNAENCPENIFFDISGWQELVGGRPDLLCEYLSSLLRAFPGRVCFGTDSPFFSYNLVLQEKHWIELVQEYVRNASESLRLAAKDVLACTTMLGSIAGQKQTPQTFVETSATVS